MQQRRPGQTLRRWAVMLALLAMGSGVAYGQAAPQGNYAQIGLAALPSFGLQTGLITAQNFFTRDVVLLTNIDPGFGDIEGSLQLSLGLGGAVRIFGIGRTIGNTAYRGFDIDVGLRFGPGITFAFKETRLTKNQRFSLYFEPFGRFTKTLGGGRIVFAEVGLHRTVFRAGMWFGL